MQHPLVVNHQQVCQSIRAACEHWHRDPATVQLLAVSKAHPSQAIRELHTLAGQRCFGENYAQELLQKSRELSDLAIEWHFIGHLQSNKISKLAGVVTCVHSLTRADHAARFAKAWRALQRPHPLGVYIAVNPAAEPQKSGISPEDAPALAAAIQQHPELRLLGIMAVPPATYRDKASVAEPVPGMYRELATLAAKTGAGQLSLGMSQDLHIAVGAGSTCLRIGTAIFGERHYEQPPTATPTDS